MYSSASAACARASSEHNALTPAASDSACSAERTGRIRGSAALLLLRKAARAAPKIARARALAAPRTCAAALSAPDSFALTSRMSVTVRKSAAAGGGRAGKEVAGRERGAAARRKWSSAAGLRTHRLRAPRGRPSANPTAPRTPRTARAACAHTAPRQRRASRARRGATWLRRGEARAHGGTRRGGWPGRRTRRTTRRQDDAARPQGPGAASR